jgi:hypothetical protein
VRLQKLTDLNPQPGEQFVLQMLLTRKEILIEVVGPGDRYPGAFLVRNIKTGAEFEIGPSIFVRRPGLDDRIKKGDA